MCGHVKFFSDEKWQFFLFLLSDFGGGSLFNRPGPEITYFYTEISLKQLNCTAEAGS